MEIKNQLKNYECEKCGVLPQPGILLCNYNGIWLCGTCMVYAMNKVRESTKKLILEE